MAARIAEDYRSRDVVVLDLTNITPIVDYFVVATGTSGRQMSAVADEISRVFKEDGDARLGIEGYDNESSWTLIDFGDVVIHRGEITFHVRREDIGAVARVLRDDPALRFEFCSSVSGVHYPDDTGRELHVVYHLASMTWNRRIRLEVTAPDSDPHVPTVSDTYPAADWHERETWDMFGIVFDGHPALTRILMPDDWPGHPQRKDYPLGGIPVEYKGGTVPPPDQRRSYS